MYRDRCQHRRCNSFRAEYYNRYQPSPRCTRIGRYRPRAYIGRVGSIHSRSQLECKHIRAYIVTVRSNVLPPLKGVCIFKCYDFALGESQYVEYSAIFLFENCGDDKTILTADLSLIFTSITVS